jgi:hypothetical protein
LAGQLEQDDGKSEGKHTGYVPCKAKRAYREFGATKQLGQIVSTEQTDEDVPLAQDGVGNPECGNQESGGMQHSSQAP